MSEYIHLVVGTPQNLPIFAGEDEVIAMKRYLLLYAQRMQMPILGYRFEAAALSLMMSDHEKLRDFLDGVLEAFMYYYHLHYQEEIRLVYRQHRLRGHKEGMELLRFLHQKGKNSLEEYVHYSRYVKKELVSVPLGWTLMGGSFSDREGFLEQLVQEPEPAYAEQFATALSFEPDKLTKRRARAKAFLDDFLMRRGINLQELMREEYRLARWDLIRAFREETDLSFRDIGYVLGMSHTSVIRILKDE